MSNVGSVCGPSSQATEQAHKPPETQRRGAHAFYKRLDTAATAAGLNANQISKLHSDIKAAVESAMKDGDGRAAIKQAVTGVLKEYGIDPASLKPRGPEHAHHHRHRGQSTGGVTTDPADPANPTDPIDPNNPTVPAPPAPTSDDEAAAALNGLPVGTLVDAAA